MGSAAVGTRAPKMLTMEVRAELPRRALLPAFASHGWTEGLLPGVLEDKSWSCCWIPSEHFGGLLLIWIASRERRGVGGAAR